MPLDVFDDDLARLQPFIEDGLAEMRDGEVRITDEGRLAVRLVCAVFDHHLPSSGARHSRAI